MSERNYRVKKCFGTYRLQLRSVMRLGNNKTTYWFTVGHYKSIFGIREFKYEMSFTNKVRQKRNREEMMKWFHLFTGENQ